MFDKIHAQRLTQLANDMETGQLLVDRFHFGTVLEQNECGSVGCAIGHAHLRWPEAGLHAGKYGWNDDKVFEFFGINGDEMYHLFMPGGQRTIFYGGEFLDSDATKKEVAANIRAFLEYKSREANR